MSANILIAIYGLYVAIKIFFEIREVIFVKNEFYKGAVLLDSENYKVAAIYAIYRHTFEIFNSLVSLFLVVLWLSGGLFIINFLLYRGDLVSEMKILFVFFAINYILTLPIHIWEKHIDKKFGFNVAPWSLFFLDEVKKIGLFLLLGGAFFAGLIYFIEHFKYWWLIGFVFTYLVIIFVNILYPYFATIFNEFKPVEGKLREDIENLLQKAGFKSNGVYIMDASTRDTRLNAYFTGLGKSKRVILFDTLVNKLTKDELLAVLGHELGHFKNKDMLKNLGLIGIVLFTIFLFFGVYAPEILKSMKLPVTGVNIVILALLFSEVIFFVFSPLINYVSRRNEFMADKFGSKLVSKEALNSALKKLVKENKHFPKVSKIYSFIYYTHPPILERLDHLMKEVSDEGINNRD